MKGLIGLGKVLALLFWGMALFALSSSVARPFGTAIALLAGMLLAFNLLVLLNYRKALQGTSSPFGVLLFGAFQLDSLSDHPVEHPQDSPQALNTKEIVNA